MRFDPIPGVVRVYRDEHTMLHVVTSTPLSPSVEGFNGQRAHELTTRLFGLLAKLNATECRVHYDA